VPGSAASRAKPGGGDAATEQRKEAPVTRGDQAGKTVEPERNRSLLDRVFTGSPAAPAPQTGQGPRGDL
jgi:hypothetical protein